MKSHLLTNKIQYNVILPRYLRLLRETIIIMERNDLEGDVTYVGSRSIFSAAIFNVLGRSIVRSTLNALPLATPLFIFTN